MEREKRLLLGVRLVEDVQDAFEFVQAFRVTRYDNGLFRFSVFDKIPCWGDTTAMRYTHACNWGCTRKK